MRNFNQAEKTKFTDKLRIAMTFLIPFLKKAVMLVLRVLYLVFLFFVLIYFVLSILLFAGYVISIDLFLLNNTKSLPSRLLGSDL